MIIHIINPDNIYYPYNNTVVDYSGPMIFWVLNIGVASSSSPSLSSSSSTTCPLSLTTIAPVSNVTIDMTVNASSSSSVTGGAVGFLGQSGNSGLFTISSLTYINYQNQTSVITIPTGGSHGGFYFTYPQISESTTQGTYIPTTSETGNLIGVNPNNNSQTRSSPQTITASTSNLNNNSWFTSTNP